MKGRFGPRLLAGLACLVGALLPFPTRALETRLISSSPDGLRLVLEIQVPEPGRVETRVDGVTFTGFQFRKVRPEGSPGAPELFVATQLIALPPGGSASLRVLETDLEDLGVLWLQPREVATLGADDMLFEDLEYDPTRYVADGPRLVPVRLGEPGRLRHQDVVPIETRPLLYNPVTRQAQLVRRLRVQIDLRPGREAAKGSESAARLGTSKRWKRIYRGALVNPQAPSSWRRAPESVSPVGGPLRSGLLRPGLLGEPEWKLRTGDTGIVQVTATELLDEGFPSGTPVGGLRLVLKRFDPNRPLEPTILEIPIQVVDTDTDGEFGMGDRVLFYAEHPRDDTTSEDPDARYDGENVYWLSVVPAGDGPPRMSVRSPRAGAVPGPTTFTQQLWYEKDRKLNEWVFSEDSELYFWDGRAKTVTVEFAVPGRAPGSSLQVCIETQQDTRRRTFRAFLKTGARDTVFVSEDPIGSTFSSISAPPRKTTCGIVPDSRIDPGNAQLFLYPTESDPSALTPWLDNVQLEYTALYQAENDRIQCTSGGASGEVQFTISGFSNGVVLRAFDVTDAKSPASFDLSGALSGGTLTLTDSIPAAIERKYVVMPDNGIGSIRSVELDQDDPILEELGQSPFGTYDVLVIVHDSLADVPVLAEWKAFREAQGWRLRIVRTSDVYDAFRGGLLHYEAIHRLTSLGFQNWGVEIVALIGDGSEDTRGLLQTSGPNLVPARVRYFTVGSSGGGFSEHRNDMNDKYYTQVAGSSNDFLPDLLIGRIPAGNPTELGNVLRKTMLYETPDPGDDGSWRKRVVLFADDEWVRREEGGSFVHRRNCAERGFQNAMMEACDTVNQAFPGDLHCVPFYLRNFSDLLFDRGFPEHRPVPLDSTCNFENRMPHSSTGVEVALYRRDVGDALVDSIGEGALFFALQGHANRSVVTCEQVITAGLPYHPVFENDGKPFIFFGFGCHLNEYAVVGEGPSGGEALGERYVLEPERGAVGSYASTGFEFLGPNVRFQDLMWNIIFNKDYSNDIGGGLVDADTLGARWLLSELLQLAEIAFGDRHVIARHLLLGDPMLHLDGGVPRVAVEGIQNGFLQSDNRLVVRDPNQPVGFEIVLSDEQGIDSLWVVKRSLVDGTSTPIDSVTVTARADTAPEIEAKRSYAVSFEVFIDECNFDIVVGARDLAGRKMEFVARVRFDNRLLANNIPVADNARVDPRMTFAFEVLGCTPMVDAPLRLKVYVDDILQENITATPDSERVNWKFEFEPVLSNGTHTLRFVFDGSELAVFKVQVGGFALAEVVAFPNPMRKEHEIVSILFHLNGPIAGGHLRILDLNGRTVVRRDLRDPGVVKSHVEVPVGSIGSGVRGPNNAFWNYIEWDGRDTVGDRISNGVYLFELQVLDQSGQALRKRDKIVIMR